MPKRYDLEDGELVERSNGDYVAGGDYEDLAMEVDKLTDRISDLEAQIKAAKEALS